MARRSSPGTWIYAAAIFGAHLAFMPLLVLLLPRRVEAIGDPQPLMLLSMLLLVGAVVASIANLAAGHLSDLWFARHGNRRAPITWGLLALVASYACLAFAQDRGSLLFAIIVFQVSLNLAFSAMGALLADYFPNSVKGRVAGLMNAALPLSSAAVAGIALLFPTDGATSFLVTAAAFAILIAPLIILWPFHGPVTGVPEPVPLAGAAHLVTFVDFLLAWTARFLIQLGAAFVIGYLYVYVSMVAAGQHDRSGVNATELVGWLSAIATVVALVAAVISGRISDALGKRRLPLSLSAILAAGGLWLMSEQTSWTGLLAGYAAFHAGLTAFVSIDAALVAQLVSGNPRRGALLGLMNLTNTLPAVLVPALTLMAIETFETGSILEAAFKICAVGAILAAAAIARIRLVD